MTAPLDRSAMAAVAQGWIMDEVPERIGAMLAPGIDAWRRNEHAPVGALWFPIVETLRRCGLWDAELSACRLVVGLGPKQPSFRLRLGECLLRHGLAAEAIPILGSLSGPIGVRADGLLAMARHALLPANRLEELEFLLLEDGQWSGRHGRMVDLLVELGRQDQARAFLGRWTARWTVRPSGLGALAMATMAAGNPAQARALFQPLWTGDGGAGLFAGFDGHVPPYDDGIEADFLARVEAAAAIAEDALPRVTLPTGPAPGVRVLMVTHGHGALPNDMAVHMVGSAAVAGVDLRLYCDMALNQPVDFLGGDAEAEARVSAFVEAASADPPDVMMIDCVAALLLRGLNPAIIADLKRRLGCKVVCLMRDSHSHAVALAQAWATVADTVLVDILSPVWGGDDPRILSKLVPLVIPAQHGPFEADYSHDGPMVFIGSTNILARRALLSVLMTEDMPFSAITGGARRTHAADMAGYAGVLGRAGAVLNISAHTPSDHLVTGRVWEAIACAAPLVEQDNPGTARFFAPWRHYLPWRSVADIVHLGHFVGRHQDIARRMGAEARAWARRHYSPCAVWGAILSHALRPRPVSEAEADLQAAAGWDQISFG